MDELKERTFAGEPTILAHLVIKPSKLVVPIETVATTTEERINEVIQRTIRINSSAAPATIKYVVAK